jgi:hypothetical protein
MPAIAAFRVEQNAHASHMRYMDSILLTGGRRLDLCANLGANLKN